jgi:uncharacterized protein involved in cysteine biosynthesis
MFGALAKAFGQLSDPASRGVVWRAVGLSVAIFVVLWAAAGFALDWAAEPLGAWLRDWRLGETAAWALEWLVQGLAWSVLLLVSFLLFPGAMAFLLSLLLEDIARAVERRHYPGLPPAREPTLVESLAAALSFFATAAILNVILLPLYLILLFVPPFNLVVFYGINGYLLGREYFEVVAARRLDSAEAKRLRRRHRGAVFVAGVIIAFLLTIPVVNLVMPLVATAFLLHLFEAMRHR